jgi:hypothetical protein
MRQVLVLAAFMLATLVWAMAQQPGTSGGQSTSPSSQTPGASQPQSSAPGSAGQGSAQSGADRGAQSQTANLPITEGCLGGSNPNFTITDKAGATYKLNLPPGADGSSLTPHVGESVQVLGQVTKGAAADKASSIDVSKIGKGTGSCPGSTSKPPNP